MADEPGMTTASAPNAASKHAIIVGLGEVLFDVFEGGTETLGGAPLNVALHAHQLMAPFGLGEGVVASRIGGDVRGMQILDLLRSRGMSTQYLQIDQDHPTGVVSVFMQNGEPGYQIEAGAAWDFISSSEPFDELAGKCDAVCFGSLAQRAPTSQRVIRRFLERAPQAIKLFDINLRRNTLTHEAGYSIKVIEESCHLATTLKLNEIELFELCELCGIGGCMQEGALRKRIEGVLTKFPMDAVILTRGAQGTTLFTRGGEFGGHLPQLPLRDVYPVGAGDACSAGFLLGSVLGWDPDDVVDLSNQMGSWVASQLSATPLLPASVLEFVRETMHSH